MHQNNPNQIPEVPQNSSVPPITVNTVPETPPSAAPKSKNNLVIISIIAILILILTAIGTFIFAQRKTYPHLAVSTYPPAVHTATTAPLATPVTSDNVDQSLGGTDTSMQTSLDQANTDLNDVNNINTSQDANPGL